MIAELSWAVAGFLGFVALFAVLAAVRPALAEPARIAMKTAHAAACVVVLVDAITLLRGHDVDSMYTHIGYMVAIALLPVVLLNRFPETDEDGNELPVEPPHPVVIAVTAVALCVLVVRLHQTW